MEKLKFRIIKNKPIVFSYNKMFYRCDDLAKIEYADDDEMLVVDINIEPEKYKKDFDEMCKILKCEHDLRYNYNNLIKYCLYHLMFNVEEMTEISQDEFNWINTNLYCEQMRYVNKEIAFTRNDIKQLDVNSMFPYTMIQLDVPISEMKFDSITEIDMKKHKVFFVKLNVQKLPEYLYQTFKNKKNWFSRYDLLMFKLFDVKYEIINEENNYAFYEKTTRIKNACILRLFENKKKNCVANMIIKKIHGLAIMRNRKKMEEIVNDMELKSACALKKQYCAGLPLFYRMKAVLYNSVKYQMATYVKKLVDANVQIIRIATDSITFFKSSILDEYISDKMGKFKIENKIDDDNTYKYNDILQLELC